VQKPELYSVTRKGPIVQRILDALDGCGVKILQAPRLTEAPFLIHVETPRGERLCLISYAFLANKYGQEGRPDGEHRFQIKYGSDFKRYHEIFIHPDRDHVTLLFGVHLEADLFIAVDPTMHNPTWFSRSIELKTEALEEAKRKGWHAWERDRSEARRKAPKPQESYLTEVLLSFKPERFLQYIELEKVGMGLDPGERMLLIENFRSWTPLTPPEHPLEKQLGLSAMQILEAIWRRKRLGVAVRGSAAEIHLQAHLEAVSGLSAVRQIDADSKPDFELRYLGRPYTLECKNVLGTSTATGPRVDFQKTRASKRDPCSRYYRRGAFDVLAACLHPVTKHWEFRFCPTAFLDPHRVCKGHLSPRVIVAGPSWQEDIRAALDSCHRV
jgi:hypothetical protein